MNIYKIQNDGFDYMELDLQVNDIIDIFPDEYSYGDVHDFSILNINMTPFWQVVTTGFREIESQKNLIPEITTWIDATLLISKEHCRYIQTYLIKSGELLPIIVENQEYILFNCTKLNKSAGNSAQSPIFKRVIDNRVEMLCSQDFKNNVEEYGLRGLTFTLL